MTDKHSPDIIERAKKVKLLIVDVDGVLTDGRIIYNNFGNEIKNFDVQDGLGMALVRRAGMKCIILTAKGGGAVKKRAKVLKLDGLYENFHYKIEALDKICSKYKVEHEEICFVGDDIIDAPLLKRVGLSVCPPNASEDIKHLAHLVTDNRGGHGAVREVCELLLKAQDKWKEVTKRYFE